MAAAMASGEETGPDVPARAGADPPWPLSPWQEAHWNEAKSCAPLAAAPEDPDGEQPESAARIAKTRAGTIRNRVIMVFTGFLFWTAESFSEYTELADNLSPLCTV
jgi:hypothetical protein